MVIDKMNPDVRRLQDAKGVVDAQIIAQKKETEAAVKTLSVSQSPPILPQPAKWQILQCATLHLPPRFSHHIHFTHTVAHACSPCIFDSRSLNEKLFS